MNATDSNWQQLTPTSPNLRVFIQKLMQVDKFNPEQLYDGIQVLTGKDPDPDLQG